MNLAASPDPLSASSPLRLDLLSVNDLAFRLGYSRGYLEEISAKVGALYEPFPAAPKHRWFPKVLRSPKRRIIDNPANNLKEIQRRIDRCLLRPLVIPHYLYGGIPGKTIIDNVRVHIGTRVLVTLDIKSFFPSITPTMIYELWTRELGCSPPVAKLLTKLTTFKRHLPQGAPTSTMLANMFLFHVDAPIRQACLQHGIRYSTWVDDLAFSGENSRAIISTAVRALNDSGLSVSHKKLRIMGTGGRMILHGILMNRFPNVVRERISNLRSGIHKLQSGAVRAEELDRYCQSLEGAIRQLSTIVPRRASPLWSDFQRAKRSTSIRQQHVVEALSLTGQLRDAD
jgi:RNA-directed DNA polymerase